MRRMINISRGFRLAFRASPSLGQGLRWPPGLGIVLLSRLTFRSILIKRSSPWQKLQSYFGQQYLNSLRNMTSLLSGNVTNLQSLSLRPARIKSHPVIPKTPKTNKLPNNNHSRTNKKPNIKKNLNKKSERHKARAWYRYCLVLWTVFSLRTLSRKMKMSRGSSKGLI